MKAIEPGNLLYVRIYKGSKNVYTVCVEASIMYIPVSVY